MIFSIQKSFKESWMMFFSKKIYLPFVWTNFLIVIGLYLAVGFGKFFTMFFVSKGMAWLLIPTVLILLFCFIYFVLVSVELPLSTYRTGSVDLKKSFKTVWDPKLIAKAFGLVAILVIATMLGGWVLSFLGSKIHMWVGMVLFLVWVTFIAVRFGFSLYILIDSKTDIITALKTSHHMMKGNGWKFLLFVLVVSIVSLLVSGLSALLGGVASFLPDLIVGIFGILFAPWFSLLMVSPFMQLKHNHQ